MKKCALCGTVTRWSVKPCHSCHAPICADCVEGALCDWTCHMCVSAEYTTVMASRACLDDWNDNLLDTKRFILMGQLEKQMAGGCPAWGCNKLHQEGDFCLAYAEMLTEQHPTAPTERGHIEPPAHTLH